MLIIALMTLFFIKSSAGLIGKWGFVL